MSDEAEEIEISVTVRIDDEGRMAGVSIMVASAPEGFDPVVPLLSAAEAIALVDADRVIEAEAPPMTADVRAYLSATSARVSVMRTLSDLPLRIDARRGGFTTPA